MPLSYSSLLVVFFLRRRNRRRDRRPQAPLPERVVVGAARIFRECFQARLHTHISDGREAGALGRTIAAKAATFDLEGLHLKLFPRSRIQINVDCRSVQFSSTAAAGALGATGPP